MPASRTASRAGVRHVCGSMVGCAVSTAASPVAERGRAPPRAGLFLIVASAALVTLLYLSAPDDLRLRGLRQAARDQPRVPRAEPARGTAAALEPARGPGPAVPRRRRDRRLLPAQPPVPGPRAPPVPDPAPARAHTALLLWGWLRLGRFLGVDGPAAWLTGVAFAASGAVVGTIHKGLIPYGDAIAWLPLIFFLAARLQDGWSARGAAQPGARPRPAGPVRPSADRLAHVVRPRAVPGRARRLAARLRGRASARRRAGRPGAGAWPGAWPWPRCSCCRSWSSSARATGRALRSASRAAAGPGMAAVDLALRPRRRRSAHRVRRELLRRAPCSPSRAWRGSRASATANVRGLAARRGRWASSTRSARGRRSSVSSTRSCPGSRAFAFPAGWASSSRSRSLLAAGAVPRRRGGRGGRPSSPARREVRWPRSPSPAGSRSLHAEVFGGARVLRAASWPSLPRSCCCCGTSAEGSRRGPARPMIAALAAVAAGRDRVDQRRAPALPRGRRPLPGRAGGGGGAGARRASCATARRPRACSCPIR